MDQDLSGNWVLRSEVFTALHRWPVIVLFILAGAGFGALVSIFWPSPYQATIPLSVELNPYRALDDRAVAAFAKVDFRNVDDYKHWQMTQLSLLMLSDDFLQETINRLEAKSTEGGDQEPGELRNSLTVSWRNAGAWELEAKAETKEQAQEAVETWRNVILEKTSEYLDYSRQLFSLELEQRASEAVLSESTLRRSELTRLRDSILDLSNEISALATGSPIPTLERWRLWSLVAQSAGVNEGWQTIISNFPPSEEEPSAYHDWIDRVVDTINLDIEILDGRIGDLQGSLKESKVIWEEALIASHGLAATLEIESVNEGDALLNRAGSVSLSGLIGGGIGFLAWMVFTLVQITRRINR